MIANTGDETDRAPRLVSGVSLATLVDLPLHSIGPHGNLSDALSQLGSAGFDALQTPYPDEGRGYGGIVAAITKQTGDRKALGDCIKRNRDAGCDSTTLHLGTGFEDEREMLSLGEAVLDFSSAAQHPVYIETHRATMTQDMWRTLRLIRRLPELRFACDFAQWYLGQEIPYGGTEAVLARLGPVFERTRLLHLRLASGSAGQLLSDEHDASIHLPVFKRVWQACCAGFLEDAKPGEYLGAYAELLPPRTGYARMVTGPDGFLIESGDRWLEALRLIDIASACFNRAIDARRDANERNHVQ